MKIQNTSLALMLLCASNSMMAFDYKSPYAGVDVRYSRVWMEENFGKDVYPDTFTTLNVHTGLSLLNDWGFELGYESELKKDEDVRVNAGSALPGLAIQTAGQFTDLHVEYKAHHPYLGIFKEFDISNQRMSKTYFKAMLAASYTMIKAKQTLIDDEIAGVPTAADIAASIRTFDEKKLAPMLTFRLRHEFANKISINANLNYRYLGHFEVKSDEVPNNADSIHLEHMFGVGLGLSYRFC